MDVPEAKLVPTDEGLVVDGDGWFVVNVAAARGTRHPAAGAWVSFESPEARFADYGINVHVLEPGKPNAKYHEESVQESFLVLHGECLLIVEEQERTLRQWDFFHCPAGTRHVLVGTERPCAVLMVGARREGATIEYPLSALAARHGASAPETTSESIAAYSDWADGSFEPVRVPWPPGE